MNPLEETAPSGHGRARGLVSSRASGARVEARTFAPPRELEPIVECLWLGRWDLPEDAPHTTRLLGDPCLHVVLGVGASDLPPARLVGVWTETWTHTLRGRGAVRAIKLRPGAAGALLEDASTAQDRVLAIDACFATAPFGGDLSAEPLDDDSAFARLVGWFGSTRRDDPETASAIAACELVRSEPRILRVSELAEATGRTERSLQRLFKLHVGASPKLVIRRHRLQEAAHRLEGGNVPSLAELAVELGYADQAHFARDWKAATSVPARRFARDVHR